jgi:hypothetical protein
MKILKSDGRFCETARRHFVDERLTGNHLTKFLFNPLKKLEHTQTGNVHYKTFYSCYGQYFQVPRHAPMFTNTKYLHPRLLLETTLGP